MTADSNGGANREVPATPTKTHRAGLVLPERGDGLHWLKCVECGREWAEKGFGRVRQGIEGVQMRAERSTPKTPRFHRPEFYRYQVSEPRRFYFMLNRYGWQVIGVACVLGRFAYCVKWAWAR